MDIISGKKMCIIRNLMYECRRLLIIIFDSLLIIVNSISR